MSFDSTWDDIYRDGLQLNRYPYDTVVAFLHAYHGATQPRSGIRILEVGCGAGNNLWFAAREGFSVVGLDGSEAAINHARERFAAESLQGEFHVGDFASIPCADDSVDVVIDRTSLTHADVHTVRAAISEIRRVLKRGGLLYSELIGVGETMASTELQDDLVEYQMKRGGHRVRLRLYDREKILDTLGDGWKYRELWRATRESLVDDRVFVRWQVVAELA